MASSQENQKITLVYKRKKVHKRSQSKPNKKVRFADAPEEHEDVQNKAIVRYEVPAMDRAKAIQASLDPKFPTFVKALSKSHVSGGFWMGLPQAFCDKHFAGIFDNQLVVLEDERGQKHETKYLVEKRGLSAGWRAFSIDHGLEIGDALVFQLIEPYKMKVFICRGNESEELDGASGNLKSKSQPKPLAIRAAHVEDDDEESAETTTVPNPVGKFRDFKIVMDGFHIDSDIPEHMRAKYYNLCTSQNEVLHKKYNVMGCRILAKGIVMETVNIANAISAKKITTELEDLEAWDKILGAFEVAGMSLGFMRKHLGKLIASHDPELQKRMREMAELEAEREYIEAKREAAKAELALKLDKEMPNAPW